MVTLSEKDVLEFQDLVKKHCNEELSYEEAYEQGTKLVNFFKLLFELEYGKDALYLGDIDIGGKKLSQINLSKKRSMELFNRDLKQKLFNDEYEIRQLLKERPIHSIDKVIRNLLDTP